MKTFHATGEVLAKINRPIDARLIKQRNTGQYKNGKEVMLSYLSGSTVIDILNSAFGTFGWSYTIIDTWIEAGKEYFQKENDKYPFDDKKCKIVLDEKGNKGIMIMQNDICHAKARLTVYVEDDRGNVREIVKEAFGSKIVVGKASEQEHIFKSAQTDALKKAASLFGIGAELYRDDKEQVVFTENLRQFVWNDELIQKHEKSWNYINNILVLNEWNYQTLEYWVSQATEGLERDIFYMPEYKLPEFMRLLKNDMEQTVSSDAEEGVEA